ncbi:MAG TPA: TRAM domain-containing protein [Acidimicrobiales bacterium]|nr:TRAM domain-containing protein [Acidimicrobiales bacterium]
MSVEVTVDRVAAGGDGIGRLAGGRVVFVNGALPGERAEVEVVEEHHDYARARAVRILDAAPGRVAPPCPNVDRGCGGCTWQHVAGATAADLKARVVDEALRRAGVPGPGPRADVRLTGSLPLGGYRTTARLAVMAGGGLGYRRHRSSDRIAVDHCLVVHPRLDEVIGATRAGGVDEVTLRVGVAGGERLAVIGGVPRDGRPGRGRPGGSDRSTRTPAGARRGRPFLEVPAGVLVVAGNQPGWLHEDVGGRRWRVSARSFFQSGPAAAAAVVDAVDAAAGDALTSGSVLVDAYAGVGVIGGILAARRGARLVAVESSPHAAADARVNLVDLDASVVADEVAHWAGSPGHGVPGRPDVVVADPARPGLGRPGVTALASTGAPRLILVSCDPASLGRDAALLDGAGYRLADVQVVDVFPGTPHVETVSRFDRHSGVAL